MISFEIKGLPPILANKKMHYMEETRLKKKWYEVVHQILFFTKQVPSKPLTKARIKCIRCSAGRPDADNIPSSFKWVIDGLVKAGVLVDDNPSVVQGIEYEWRKAKAKEGKIIVNVWGEV